MEFRFLRFSLLPDTGQPLALNTAVQVLQPRPRVQAHSIHAAHGAWPWVRSPSSSAESGSWVVSRASRRPWPLRTAQGTVSGALSPVPGTSLRLQACFPAVDSETRTEQWVSCCLKKILNVYDILLSFLIAGSKTRYYLFYYSLEQIYHLRGTQMESAHSITPFPLQK